MSVDTSFKIYSTNYNSDSNYLTINYREKNKETSLTLHGPDAFNYGQDYLTNLVHLTENFCNTTAPGKPIKGQKFYNSETKKLSVYDTEWNEINIVPNTDYLDVVYDTAASLHNDRVLSTDLKKYIPLTGNTTPCDITLLDVEPTIDNQAVPKKYATNLITNSKNYLPRIGNATMTGPLQVMEVAYDITSSPLVNVKYVKGLGDLRTISDHSDPNLTVTKFAVSNKIVGEETDNSKWFCTIGFNNSIAAGSASVEIKLPVTFDSAKVPDSIYTHNMIVTCNTTGAFEQLFVTINNGSTITIARSVTTNKVDICGTIYGFLD